MNLLVDGPAGGDGQFTFEAGLRSIFCCPLLRRLCGNAKYAPQASTFIDNCPSPPAVSRSTRNCVVLHISPFAMMSRRLMITQILLNISWTREGSGAVIGAICALSWKRLGGVDFPCRNVLPIYYERKTLTSFFWHSIQSSVYHVKRKVILPLESSLCSISPRLFGSSSSCVCGTNRFPLAHTDFT